MFFEMEESQMKKFLFCMIKLWTTITIHHTTATPIVSEKTRRPNILMLVSDDLRSQLGGVSGVVRIIIDFE